MLGSTKTTFGVKCARVLIQKCCPTIPSLRFSTSTTAYNQPYPSPSTLSQQSARKITIRDIQQLYLEKKPITAITAHDYLTGKFANDSNADMVLIGDSLAMVQLGYPSTNQLRFDEFVYISQAVSRAVQHKFLVADLPFGTFESSTEKAIESSVKLMSQCENIQAVKIEGGSEFVERFKKLHDVGITVVGHVGLTPQRHNFLGGYRVQGNQTLDDCLDLFQVCLDLQNKGKVKMLVIECVPQALAKIITDNLSIPTIGIGAGKFCSGQILVQADLLGMVAGSKAAKFVKQYENFYHSAVSAINSYDSEVKQGSFPAPEHTYKMKKELYQDFEAAVQEMVKKY